MTVDYLIIGQGIAGSMFAWQALKRGKSIRVIDAFNPAASSQVATGVINPVTGRKMNRSWMIDTVLPVARSTYRSIEKTFGIRILHERPVYRLLSSEQDVAEWANRKQDPLYIPYLGDVVQLDIPGVLQPFGAGEIRGGCWVDIPPFIRAMREHLSALGCLEEGELNLDAVDLSDGIVYRDVRARHLVCCEGFRGRLNPFFAGVPLSFAKGEILEVDVPGLDCPYILNRNQFLLPLGGSRYLAGSTFAWDDTSETVSEKGRREIMNKLSRMISLPFSIVGEKAGIRPTITDRRPVLGASRKHKNVYLFNGLGTKGISLSPYFSGHLLDHIETGSALHPACDIRRFFP